MKTIVCKDGIKFNYRVIELSNGYALEIGTIFYGGREIDRPDYFPVNTNVIRIELIERFIGESGGLDLGKTL